MDKIQNKGGKMFSEELAEDLINIKEEKDLIKSLPSSDISPIITIKELINSLKEKINTYEKQIKKLIDDKVKLQMEMNEMILQNLQSKKKNININENINNKENSSDINNKDLINNLEKDQNKIIVSSLIDINQKLIEQNKELKEQIDIYKNNLEIYKEKIKDFKSNKNVNNNNSVAKCQFCEEKKLELNKMEEEKKEIVSSITSLRNQLEELKYSEKLKKDKKKKREKIRKTESLPNIEQYFILNNKFQLVDSDKNLWHMKKCLKFQEFKKKFEGKNISSDDILKDFVDAYDSKIEEEKSEENDYLEALNMSANESEDTEKKRNENKYMPPLPGMSNNSKKRGGNKNHEIDNGNNIQEINNSDIQINIDENEGNKKDGTNNTKKEEEKKNDSNDINENGNVNFNNLNEIKEETSFNLSDNTE